MINNNFRMQREHAITIAEVMTPEKANFTGNIHGGHILSLLDKAAYACAARYSGKDVVTLSVDRVFFKEPVHVGELVTCFASVNYVGHTSMEIGIKVQAENIKTGAKRHTNTCYFTMVAIDENFKPTPIPKLVITSATAKRRNEEAKLRKDLRIHALHEHESRKAQESSGE